MCIFLFLAEINSTAAKWEVTNSSITATIQGLFSRGTAVPKSQIRESVNAQISGTNVSFSGLIPGETYDISLFYEIDLLQYTDSLTLSKFCSYDNKIHPQ